MNFILIFSPLVDLHLLDLLDVSLSSILLELPHSTKIDQTNSYLVVRPIKLHQMRETISEYHKGCEKTYLGNHKNII